MKRYYQSFSMLGGAVTGWCFGYQPGEPATKHVSARGAATCHRRNLFREPERVSAYRRPEGHPHGMAIHIESTSWQTQVTKEGRP